MFEPTVAPSADEVRAELQSILESVLFARSTRLSQLLQYLCTKHLQGAVEEVKEYQIGVEVLGRPATFDPADDAAARVEVHRLRKRLREYYDTEGRSHRLRIEVPLGHYAVVIQPMTAKPRTDENGDEAPSTSSPVSSASPSPTYPQPRAPWRFILQVAAIVTIVAIAFITLVIIAFGNRLHTAREPVISKTSVVPLVPAPTTARILPLGLPAQSSVRIACGTTRTHTDRWGEVWEADRDYEGGTAVAIPRQFVARAHDPKLFQSGRTGSFTYKIPLSPGTYELHLYFNENTYGPAMPAGGGEISRLFDVLVNGKPLLTRFDIYSDAGGSNIADIRTFKDISPGPGQILTLTFLSRSGLALVNGIELTPAAPHRLNPIRIVAQEGFYTDSTGAVWKPDRYYSGGQSATHSVEVRGTRDPDLFARERYGHFDYAIPVDKGTYQLSLYFAEEYFGPGTSHGGQPGTRVFEVTCNGSMLLHEFDLLKTAGVGQAVVKTFHGLTPNGQGALLVSFLPIHDYASLYALEVIDESN